MYSFVPTGCCKQYSSTINMTVDPKEDIDICITCLTKKAPKLPLREELPSLGVELIYKARGTGAKISKHEARRAAKDYRYTESFKDLKKRRLFPKSSRRIKGILEERRRRESELKHMSSAVSYESYQNELYGGWATDTSSSTQSKSSSSSISVSSVDEIKTARNRRMTKVALKRWRLFRKKSKKRKEKANKKIEEEKWKKEKRHKQAETKGSLGSLIGEDVFVDFLAPVQRIDDIFDQSDSESSQEQGAIPSWYSGISQRKAQSKVSDKASWYADLPKRRYHPEDVKSEQTPSPKAHSTIKNSSPTKIQNKRTSHSGYFDDDDFARVGWLDEEYDSNAHVKSPASTRQNTLSSQEIQSPPSGRYDLTPTSKNDKGTPTTAATSIGFDSSPEPTSKVSSVTESPQATRREKLYGVNNKVSRYLSQRKGQRETDPTLSIPEAASNESNSDTSLIGLSVAFPKDDSVLDSSANLGPPMPALSAVQKSYFERVTDSYVSEDSDSAEENKSHHPNEEESGVFDGVPTSVYPANNFSWKDASLLGTNGPSEDFCNNPSSFVNKNTVEAQETSGGNRNSFDPYPQPFEDIPEDLYQAFGKDEHPKEGKQSQHAPIYHATVVIPGQEETSEISSYHPIVPGKDFKEGDDEREFEESLHKKDPVNDSSQKIPKVDNHKWWSGVLPNLRNIREYKKDEDDSNFDKKSTDPQDHEESVTKKETNNMLAYFPPPEANTVPKMDEATAQAFSNIPDEFYGALTSRHNQAKFRQEEDDQSLRYVIKEKQTTATQYDTGVEEIMKIISEDPTLSQIKDTDDGQMLLHRFVASPFPPHVDLDGFLDLLLEDIRIFQEKLDVIYASFPAASEVVDSGGDLPVHLLARNLMEWETTWYARVYQQASKESENPVSGGPATAAITTLYHTMSQCVETLLKRVVVNENLCRERGSVGCLLPVHIATIFTASVPTLRQALESYPVGALEAASIKGFDSFVPDGALPIEIHESFCTDFPKWEMEMNEGEQMKWSQGREADTCCPDDRIRRSDLLFAYNPSVQRFWKDTSRIRRFEHRINLDTKLVAEQSTSKRIPKASELVWIWMCTFLESKHSRAPFTRSIERILDDLPMSLVRMLATIPSSTGEPVLDVAHPDCVAVIRNKLDSLCESITPVPTRSGSSLTSSKVLQSWEETQSSRFSQAGKVTLGQVCRAIFNIKEKGIPTSFVILPYKLARTANGTLGMANADSAAVAVNFADCLLKLTDPRSVLYFLDKKSESYFGVSMYQGADDVIAREKAFSQVASFEKALLELYSCRPAYLYLLDEETGVPLVPRYNGIYPMVLHEPVSMVRKLLPMMISGMIQMRGDKAVSVISTVLLDDSICIVPSHYESAAKKLSVFIHSIPKPEECKMEDSVYIKSELNRFFSLYDKKRHRNEETLTGTTEWNVELSILRMLFEVNDPECKFSGLKKAELGDEEIRWEFDENAEANDIANTYVARGRAKEDNEGSSQSSDQSPTDSYTTFGADPLKFHQPPDDATETTYETQATRTLLTQDGMPSGSNLERHSDVDVRLALTVSDDTTESERIYAKNNLLSDTFGVKILACSNIKGGRDSPIWNPAEQVWADVHNRLDVTGFFWDESQVTSLRVSLLQQANKICQLQKRIGEIKQEESKHSQRVRELFCKIMGDNCNVLEVPSPRSLFGARKLLARLNDLEARVLESEVDTQHFTMGVKVLNEEILDLVPLIEEELSAHSSSYSIETISSHDVKSCISDSEASGIQSRDAASSKIISYASESIAEENVEGREKKKYSSSEAEGWTASRSIERIRKAFAAARREAAASSSCDSVASGSAGKLQQNPPQSFWPEEKDDQHTRVSTLTDSRSAALREQAAAARSRAIAAAQPTQFPFEIALPALDHLHLVAPAQRNDVDDNDDDDDDDENIKAYKDFDLQQKDAFSDDSSSSRFMNTSVVCYDKNTGMIEF